MTPVVAQNTQYGIVYATNSKIIRRVIVPDQDEHLTNGTHPLANGETMLLVPAGSGHQYSDWVAQVEAATGVTPPSAACAVVDGTNTVIAVVQADPALDTHPSGKLVSCYSSQIGIGCTYSLATGLFTIPAYTIPAGTINKSTGLPSAAPVLVPAQTIPNLTPGA